MRPLICCEKTAFRKLVMELSGITDSSLLPNRRQLANDLKIRYSTYVNMMTDLIKNQNYICITADIWSTNNKSYMGMTFHYIDEITYERQSYVLGCRRIIGTHNFLAIAKVITEVMNTFCIINSKVTHIITDNASNFGKCFRTFSSSSTSLDHSTANYDIGNLNSDESGSDTIENSDSDSEHSDENIETIDVGSIFCNQNDQEQENDNSYYLPNHITCVAHSLNLIATTDISKITDETYISLSTKSFNKLQAFWNLLSRSTKASDKVVEHCNCKFPIPVITRWNSKYDATKKILEHKKKLVTLFDILNLQKLNSSEWLFLEEYCTLLEPLANSLDKLQGEKHNYLGYVAPTLIVLRKLLIQSTNLKHCRPLCLSLITSLEKRFNYIFDLSDPKSKTYIIASISHPKFKLSWVPVRYKNLCKNIFLNECETISITIENKLPELTDNEDSDSDGFFNNLSEHSTININSPTQTQHYDSTDDNNIRVSNAASVQALTFLNSKKKELVLLDQFKIIKQVFLKFNTTLPSSAPVERLFSGAIQVLTPRRNRLKDDTFEMLLCCRSQK